jgi:2-aminoadipate transaminase
VSDRTIDFTRGIPPSAVFPVEALIDCQQSALQRDPAVLLQYGHSPGYAPLCDWLADQHGVSRDQVMTGNSSLELLSFVAQRLITVGARAFVELPSYDRAIALFRRSGAQVVGIPMQADGVDFEELEAELQRGVPALMYVIPDFQNPTGVTMSLHKRKALALLAEEYGFWIVEDAPYRLLRFSGETLPSLYSLAPHRVLHMSSFSKILAPGIRLGYLIGAQEMIAALVAWAVDTYIGPVLPTQGMVYEYCRRGLLQPNIRALQDYYRPRLEAVAAGLGEHLPDVEWSRPEGGFFVGVTLPAATQADDLLARAASVRLRLSDGRGFFAHPTDGDRFVRIPFCSVTPDEIQEGVMRLATLV